LARHGAPGRRVVAARAIASLHCASGLWIAAAPSTCAVAALGIGVALLWLPRGRRCRSWRRRRRRRRLGACSTFAFAAGTRVARHSLPPALRSARGLRSDARRRGRGRGLGGLGFLGHGRTLKDGNRCDGEHRRCHHAGSNGGTDAARNGSADVVRKVLRTVVRKGHSNLYWSNVVATPQRMKYQTNTPIRQAAQAAMSSLPAGLRRPACPFFEAYWPL
jgi:hypothetical protein